MSGKHSFLKKGGMYMPKVVDHEKRKHAIARSALCVFREKATIT